MDLEWIVAIATAIGTIFTAIALILNAIQFKRLETSIRGNTYQQLALIAVELKKLLLEYPDLDYLYTKNSGDKRRQFIFERLVANYLDDAWYQKEQGLLDDKGWEGFDLLTREIIKEHPEILKLMLQPNFSKEFREYISKKIAIPDEQD